MGRGRAAGNLPFAVTGSVGRLREIGGVRTLLETARLVTLAGGVGKTWLALEVATGAGKAFADGGWLVDLAAGGSSTGLIAVLVLSNCRCARLLSNTCSKEAV
jgi:hypothetical protein